MSGLEKKEVGSLSLLEQKTGLPDDRPAGEEKSRIMTPVREEGGRGGCSSFPSAGEPGVLALNTAGEKGEKGKERGKVLFDSVEKGGVLNNAGTKGKDTGEGRKKDTLSFCWCRMKPVRQALGKTGEGLHIVGGRGGLLLYHIDPKGGSSSTSPKGKRGKGVYFSGDCRQTFITEREPPLPYGFPSFKTGIVRSGEAISWREKRGLVLSEKKILSSLFRKPEYRNEPHPKEEEEESSLIFSLQGKKTNGSTEEGALSLLLT